LYQPHVNVSPSHKKLKQLFGLPSGYQQETTTQSPLGELAKKTGGEKTDVKKVTIHGDAPKPGHKHGQLTYNGKQAWDSNIGAWVPRNKLTPLKPKKVVIDTAPSKKPEK
jgi:hypothetical protein